MIQKQMTFLALSGSARLASTNAALLRALGDVRSKNYSVKPYDAHLALPIFNPDNEGINTPALVEEFCAAIADSDGIIISSPEYVHAVPGGLKNAIDWLVSRQEMISKPVVLAHASPRGDDMLNSLRLIMSTVTSSFDAENFLKIPLMGLDSNQIDRLLKSPAKQTEMRQFLDRFHEFICLR